MTKIAKNRQKVNSKNQEVAFAIIFAFDLKEINKIHLIRY